jgi:hypothetical protein
MFAVAEEKQKNDASEVKKMLNVCGCRGQRKTDSSERRGSMFADVDERQRMMEVKKMLNGQSRRDAHHLLSVEYLLYLHISSCLYTYRHGQSHLMSCWDVRRIQRIQQSTIQWISMKLQKPLRVRSSNISL